MVKKPQIMMQNSPIGIVVNPRTDSLVLPFPDDYSHLFENKTDWSRVVDLVGVMRTHDTDTYLGGGTVNNWLFRGERGRDTDLLAVVNFDRVPEWFMQISRLGEDSNTQMRTIQFGNYGYIVVGPQPVKKYMNIDSGVERIELAPIRTLDEHSLNVTPKTIDLSLTSEANFRRCYKNLNTMGARE